MKSAEFERGHQKRIEVLGSELVEKQYGVGSDMNERWQSIVTSSLWGQCWTDERLSIRDRLLVVLGMLAGAGKKEEFRGYVAVARRNGLEKGEIEAIAIQAGLYGGVPTGNMCRQMVKEAFDLEQSDASAKLLKIKANI